VWGGGGGRGHGVDVFLEERGVRNPTIASLRFGDHGAPG
jgi:hypothetical protein